RSRDRSGPSQVGYRRRARAALIPINRRALRERNARSRGALHAGRELVRSALGIDVGSTTAKAVVLAAGGRVVHRACERHRGRPREVALRLAAEAREAHAPSATGVTGSI